MSDDQMETAILGALELAPAADKALQEIDSLLSPRERRRVHEFSGRLEIGMIFEDRDIYDLEDLLAPFQSQIEAGWVTHWVHDENHVDGGWLERVLDPKAAKLEAKTRPLFQLLDMLVHVQNLKRAEDVLIKILEQRHR